MSFEQQLHKKLVQDYKTQSKQFIVTSRFNNNTWSENMYYRLKHKNIGCMYCCPDPISSQIPIESVLFVLEMNNDIDKIMGIGFIKNKPSTKHYFVYENDNYNRYSYIGNIRIDRTEMTEEEEEIMQVFDILCFSGNKHMKRGQGLKAFPIDMLYKMSQKLDLVKFISKMFRQRILQTNK
jgi:hypothetical protein